MTGRVARVVGGALAMLALVSAVPASSAGDARAKASRPASSPYVTQAPIVMLKDLETGRILFSRGSDKRFAPASMAKVMTAYVVFDLIEKGELPRDRIITVGEATWKKWNGSNGGSTMFLRAGEKISVDDLLKGLITVSANDAAAALAVGIDGSEDAFVKRMNIMASKLGMTSSRFGTPVGWPDGGVTKVSAGDLILLADRLINDHPADKIYRTGLSMSINTDGRTVSPVTLTSEYETLHQVFGWDKEQLLKCNLEAIAHAFTSEEVKIELAERIRKGFS